MSNEIKNTLFRFVSMRTPELVADAIQKPGFVYQNQNDKVIFNTLTANIPSGSTKQGVLKSAAANFEPNAKSAEFLKNLNPKLYEFSVWLSKNRLSASTSEIGSKAKSVSSNTIDLKIIWENLFYQVITQKDFYVKEVAMQLLLAHHVRFSILGSYKERALAKVVLPKEVFVEDLNTQQANSKRIQAINASEVPFASHTLQKLEKQAVAQENIDVLTKLQLELSVAENAYRKQYQEEYDLAYERYYQSIKKDLDTYYAQIETTKNQWCEIRNPNIVYDPSDPCQQMPKVPEPELPKFEFTFTKEMDSTFLSNFLSSQSIEALNNLTNNEEDEEQSNNAERTMISSTFLSNSLTSFSTTNSLISQLINENGNSYSQNTVNSGSTSLVIGGTTLNVPNTVSPLLPFEYEIKTTRKSLFFSTALRTLQVMVGIPDVSWKITAIQYKMTRNDGTFVLKSSSTVKHFTGYDALINLSMTGINADLSEFSITFQFTNGQTATVVIPNFVLTSIYKGTIQFPVLEEFEEEEGNSTGSSGNSTIAPDETFIPTGFGIKQIGIADYNKVEQTIQGYVEGEVAHIENIMAREFKEKSTRRLSRREVTETTSSETEREQLTDTSTVNRFEMQSEVAKVIANSKDFSGGVNATYKFGDKFILNANANYATNNSKEESARQAVTNAKEITERALDRIVS